MRKRWVVDWNGNEEENEVEEETGERNEATDRRIEGEGGKLGKEERGEKKEATEERIGQ